MTQRHNEPIGKYAIRLNLAVGKVRLQSMEALGSTEEERRGLLIDHLLQSMNPKLQGRVAHVVDGKAAHDRPTYWQLVKFAVKKEAEINFDKAKKAPKPKITMHFHFDCKKLSLPVNPIVQMVAPAPEEDAGEEEATPQPSEDSDSGKSYEAQDDLSVSPGDVEVAIRIVCASRAFSGRCFRCNKVGHWFHDKECEMYDPKFLNSGQGPTKTSQGWKAPEVKGQPKSTGTKATH